MIERSVFSTKFRKNEFIVRFQLLELRDFATLKYIFVRKTNVINSMSMIFKLKGKFCTAIIEAS
jgi:hypothetical protein